MTRRLVTAACITAVVLAPSACGGEGDKAGGGGDESGGPLTLSLAAYSEPEPEPFVAAVQRLSRGSIRIRATTRWRDGQPDYEEGTIADVRRGDVDLAIVGARVFDLLGTTSFQGVLAPFLVDSLALESRVLRSPLANRMLAGVAHAGVVGLGVLPGALRRPIGFRRRTISAGDFRGAVVGVRRSALIDRTYRALGAQPLVTLFRDLGAIDATDYTVTSLDFAHYDESAQTIGANVALWPHVLVVIANRDTYADLGPKRRALLRRAVREAFAPTFEEVERNEDAALGAVCRRGKAVLVSASPAQRAELRGAVEPIYDALRRDELARDVIAAIEQMRGASAPEELRCPHVAAPEQGSAAPVDGTWRWSVTEAELLAAGDTPSGADRNTGRWQLVLDKGRYEARNLDTGDAFTGGYDLVGDRLVAHGEGAGATDPATWYRWSLFRGRLRLAPVVGSPMPAAPIVVVKPMTRAA